MATQIQQHDCSTCRFKQTRLDIVVDDDDIKVYERIQTKVINAQQAANPNSLESLTGGEEVSAENRAAYFQAALKNLQDAKDLLSEWWQEMIKKYNVPMSAKVDTEARCFYHCVDDEGNVSTDGEWQPKE